MDLVFLCGYRGDHFFGTGLACTSCNAYDFDIKRISVELCDVKQRLSRGFHKDVRKIRLTEIFVGNNAERTGFDGIRDKLPIDRKSVV